MVTLPMHEKHYLIGIKTDTDSGTKHENNIINCHLHIHFQETSSQ